MGINYSDFCIFLVKGHPRRPFQTAASGLRQCGLCGGPDWGLQNWGGPPESCYSPGTRAGYVEGQTGVYKIGEDHLSPAILQVQGRAIYVEGQTGVYKIGEDHVSPAILQVQGSHTTTHSDSFEKF